jgi:cytochrome c oxidase subunit III
VSSEALEIHDAHAVHTHAHQFDDPVQQKESATLGMWAFLATEVLFFGGLFLLYTVFRYRFPTMWNIASHELDIYLGGLNTLILLTSSLTMALGVHASQTGKKKALNIYLILTFLLAGGFLVVKTFEYKAKYDHGLIPGRYFQVPAELWEHHKPAQPPPGSPVFDTSALNEVTADPMGPYAHGPEGVTASRPQLTPENTDDVRKLQLFFGLYFAMTGLHGIHVVIGMVMIASLVFLNQRGWFSKSYYTPVEMTGLYWHFVDIVWVFLFPLLYLMDRSHHP